MKDYKLIVFACLTSCDDEKKKNNNNNNNNNNMSLSFC